MELKEGSSCRRSRVRSRSHSPLSRSVRQKLEETPRPAPDQTEKRPIAAIGKSVPTIGLTDHRRPRFRSRSWSPPSSYSSTFPEKKKTGTGRKRLFMFVHSDGPPNDHLLYEVEIPAISYTDRNEISAPLLHPCTTIEPLIYPIHEFESDKYPISLCSVQLGSRLYFLGGSLPFYDLDEFSKKVDPSDAKWYDVDKIRTRSVFEYFPRDVHVYDTASREFSSNSIPSMHSGKYFAYAFVAWGKIFILGLNPKTNIVFRNDYKLNCFECFDPVTQEWSILPDPISDSFVIGHIVKDNSVYVLDYEENMYSFNLKKCLWRKVHDLHNFKRDFVKGAVYIDDKMYAIRSFGRLECLAAYGTVIPSGPEGEAFWDSELTMGSSLIHLDGNIICYVCMRFVEEDVDLMENLEHTREIEEDDMPKDYQGSRTKFEVKVNIFGVPGRIFAQEGADGLGALFQGEHYYDKTIIAGRKCDTDLRSAHVRACFLVDFEE